MQMSSDNLLVLKDLLGDGKCFQCRSPLVVEQVYGGWAYCTKCDFAADIIEIGAIVWKCEPRQSLQQLTNDYGLKLSGQTLAVSKRAKWRQFVAKYGKVSPTSEICQQYIGTAVRWTPGLGVIATARSFKQMMGTQIKLQAGKNDYCLFLPLYLPRGRICGVLAYTLKDGQPTLDSQLEFEFDKGAPLLLNRRINDNPIEFIFDNPLEATALQLRWLASHTSKLPVAAYYTGTKHLLAAGDLVTSEKTVIVADYQKPMTAVMGCRLDLPVTDAQPLSPVTGVEREWLNKIAQEKFPWVNILVRQYNRGHLNDQHFKHIPLLTATRERLRLPAGLLDKCRASTGVDATISPDIAVLETDEGWRSVKKRTFLSNYNIRIDQTVMAGKDVYYRCSARRKAEHILFVITERDARSNGLLRAAQQELRKSSPAVELQFNPRWNSRSLCVATAIQPPVVVQTIGRLGWIEDSKQLQFASFALDEHGRLLAGQRCMPTDIPLPSDNVPPVVVTPDRLPVSADNFDVWLAIGVVAWQLLAPAMSLTPTNIAVVGEVRDLCVSMFQLLGCRDESARYGWPILTTNNNLLAPRFSGYICVTDRLSGLIAAAKGHPYVPLVYPFVEARERAICAGILTAFLSHVLANKNRLNLGSLYECASELLHWASFNNLTTSLPKHLPPAMSLNKYTAALHVVRYLWQESPDSLVEDVYKGDTWFSSTRIVDTLNAKGITGIPLDNVRRGFEMSNTYAGEVPSGKKFLIGISTNWLMNVDIERSKRRERLKFSVFG